MKVYYTKCLIEAHACLVVFDYGSDNNVVSQRLVEKLQLPTTFHPESSMDQIQYSATCERSVM